ncbi:acyl carrier protein [Streptomyces sp. SID3343]|uniref:acyl carrier protein n=1 Tax=Streptomyces sp. SID3343 TaxID=2690260 RepID=UPI001371E5F0|nr:acyl carrier protein [Streptomyces sp. SID3343]
MATIEERVKTVVRKQLGLGEEQVRASSDFFADLGADENDGHQLVIDLEEEFDLEIPAAEAEKITTVQDAIDYVTASRR